MDYEVKYKEVQRAVENFYSAAKSLDDYAQRLSNVKSSLGLFSSLTGFKRSIGDRAVVSGAAAAASIDVGQCLDNIRIEYLLSEQIAYQLISGDTSFVIGDGITPVIVPELNGNQENKAWWEKNWGDVVNAGKSAVKVVNETWSAFQYKIRPGGDWYEEWQIIKTAGKVVVGVVTFVGVCTTGNPFAIIYGANKLLGAGYDIGSILTGNYESVDALNPLKSVMQWTGGFYGGLLGYEEVGRMIGGGLYYLGDIASIFNSITNLSGIKDIMNLPINSNLYRNVGTAITFMGSNYKPVEWFYKLALAGYNITNRINKFWNPMTLAY